MCRPTNNVGCQDNWHNRDLGWFEKIPKNSTFSEMLCGAIVSGKTAVKTLQHYAVETLHTHFNVIHCTIEQGLI